MSTTNPGAIATWRNLDAGQRARVRSRVREAGDDFADAVAEVVDARDNGPGDEPGWPFGPLDDDRWECF